MELREVPGVTGGGDRAALPTHGGPRGPRGHGRHRGQPAGLTSDRSPMGPLDGDRATKEETMSGPSVRGEPVIEELTEVWASIVVACGELDEEQWDRPTDCPGWTVKDQVSHLIGIEQALLGQPSPPPLSDVPAHVLNPFGEMNEAWVEARRRVPGPEVLAEFVATTN